MVRELKSWLFQCDACYYSHTEKAVDQPDKPPSWELVKVMEHTSNCAIQHHFHFCSECVKRHGIAPLKARVENACKRN